MTNLTTRIAVPAMDEILGVKYPVGPDGFVRVVDYMGGDQSVVRAARISYGEGTRPVQDDETLIRYLMRHRHTSPFEMAEIVLHVRAPMDAWRQWIRHRTSSVNEYSTRYSLAIDSVAIADEWRTQSTNNKQGSSGTIDDPTISARLTEREQELHRLAREVYEERIAAGVAREQARKDLPLSTYTEAIWKIDLHNLLHFLKLRLDAHAQKEIRDYAKVIFVILGKWVPLTQDAFDDYVLNAVTFSSEEMRQLKIEKVGHEANLSKRERAELDEKLRLFGG